MLIHNKSVKPVFVGGKTLMPGESIELSAEEVKNPGISALIRVGILGKDDTSERVSEVEKEAYERGRKEALAELAKQAEKTETDDTTEPKPEVKTAKKEEKPAKPPRMKTTK